MPPEFEIYIQEIKQRIPHSFYQRAMSHISNSKQTEVPEEVSFVNQPPALAKLVSLNKNIKHLREEISRLKMKQKGLIKTAVFVEDLLDTTCTLEGAVKDMANAAPHFTPSLANRLKIAFTLSVWPCLSKVIGVTCAILSSLLILIEVLGFCNKSIEDYLKSIISRRDNWAVATISLVIFCYAIFSVHFAVFRFKFNGFYNLYYGHQTDTASLLYSGM